MSIAEAKQLRRTETEAVWINVNSENNDTHVALFDLGDEEQTMTVSLEELEADKTYTLHELWDKTDAQITGNEVKAAITGTWSEGIQDKIE